MKYYIGNYYVMDGSHPEMDKVKKTIKWIELDINGDKSLLISEDVLDWECFDDPIAMYEESTENVYIDWQGSCLKKYLEKKYYSYFSEDEKDAIVESELGHMFPLSKDELEKYLPSSEARRAVSYEVYKNDEKDEIEECIEHYNYWIRPTEKCIAEETPYVTSLGIISDIPCNCDETGIRPAMWVKTDKARLLTAAKGRNMWHHYWELEEY